jgi:hypothetical protein
MCVSNASGGDDGVDGRKWNVGQLTVSSWDTIRAGVYAMWAIA